MIMLLICGRIRKKANMYDVENIVNAIAIR